jgi:undecaprenyl-diphosphatase
MRRTEREALALGLLHGPLELLPVSSSGHVAALPQLLGWELAGWPGERRKELEVALHAGTAAALVLAGRPRRMRPGLQVAAGLPPAVAGLVLERRIEQRLGTPGTLPAGLVAGGAALLVADRSSGRRLAVEAGIADGLRLGLAQTSALFPGVSRSGATLAAARARGFARVEASLLSSEVSLPVLLGASGLKAWRLAGGSRSDRRPLALGAGAAFVSTLAALGTLGLERRGPLWPWAAWRALLAGAILAVRHNRAR